ncbi:MAG: hypothetical protein ACJ8C4_18235 [Gemmataceae bacterium]
MFRQQNSRLRLESLESRDTPSAPTSWAVRGSGGGGALYAPSFGWSDATDMTIASDMSNLFHSTNQGSSWTTYNQAEIQGNHYAHVSYTTNLDIRYCLDYSNVSGLDLVRPSKTTDGGVTWTPLAGDPTGGNAYNLFADPLNPNHLFVSDYNTVYWSSNGGSSFAAKFSTSDNNTGVHVAGAFFDGNNVYIGTNKGLYVSSDAGSTFALSSVGGIPATEAIVSFSGGKVGSTVRLFAVTLGSGQVYAGITGADYGGYHSVYTLDVGQASWMPHTTGIVASAHPFFIATAANDINTAYIAGGSDAGAPIVYKTQNGGASWFSVFLTTNNQNINTGWQGQGGDRSWGYGEYALGLAAAPQNSSRVVITDLGGAHISVDAAASWQALYVDPADRHAANAATPTGLGYHDSGLDNTTSWSLTWASPSTMILGNSDVKGQRSTDGGQTWGFGYTGHNDNSMYRSFRAANGTLYAATSTIHDMYESTRLTDATINSGTGHVLFSTNNGATWQTLHTFADPVVWVAPDPNNANRMYASVVNNTAGGIFVSSNINLGSSSTWTQLTNPTRTEGHPFNVLVLNDGTLVASYSGRRNSAGAFTDSSGVFVSTDGGSTWLDRSDPGMHYWTWDVVVDPADASQNTWFVEVFSGWGGAPNNKGGLYKTTNRGASWTKINSLDRVASLTIDPVNNDIAYLTTETQGLWYTSNLHATSPIFTQVTSYPFRQPTRVFFNPNDSTDVWVTSFGGGLMEGRTAIAPAVSAIQVNDGSAQRSQVTSLQVTFNQLVSLTSGAFTISGPAGSMSYTLSTSLSTPTQTVAVFSFLQLADGRYQFHMPAQEITNSAGQHLTTDYQYDFHRFFGDANGDATVDQTDYLVFRNSIGTSDPIFDFNNDNAVDQSDYLAFRDRIAGVI